jgi:cob(I)alamin adenosyltransferase
MLYTRKGDTGTTKTFGCDQRISKSSIIAEALGSLDEINSYLGFCKVKCSFEKLLVSGNVSVDKIVHNIQKNLFIVQAELAGASMFIDEEKVKEVEKIIDSIEKELPPIKTFFISGGTELASIFDIARTISRRAERRVVGVTEEGKTPINKSTLAYLNRLSSLLYAFARLANHRAGIDEESPDYK